MEELQEFQDSQNENKAQLKEKLQELKKMHVFGKEIPAKPIALWLIKLCTIFGSRCVLGLIN